MDSPNQHFYEEDGTPATSFYDVISNLLETIARIFFWFGKYVIVQLSIIGLIVLGLYVWYDGTRMLFDLVGHSQTTAIQYRTIGVMETYLSAIVLFILALGLHGIFVAKPSRRTRLPVEIRSVAELDSYLFSAITSVLLVAALREVLSSDSPFDWNKVIAASAMVVVISIYLACQKTRE